MVPAHDRDPGDFFDSAPAAAAPAAAASASALCDQLADFRDPLDDRDGLVAEVPDEGQDVRLEGPHRDRVGVGPGAVDVPDHGDAEDAAGPVGAGQEVEELRRLGRGRRASEFGLLAYRR